MTDKTKQRIQELCPDILELKFGCEVQVDDEVMIATHWSTSNDSLDVYAPDRADDLHHVFNLYPKEFVILGSPITLAVVLRAINAVHKPIYVHSSQQVYRKDGTYLGNWNLTKDNYDDQSEETKSFIGVILQV